MFGKRDSSQDGKQDSYITDWIRKMTEYNSLMTAKACFLPNIKHVRRTHFEASSLLGFYFGVLQNFRFMIHPRSG